MLNLILDLLMQKLLLFTLSYSQETFLAYKVNCSEDLQAPHWLVLLTTSQLDCHIFVESRYIALCHQQLAAGQVLHQVYVEVDQEVGVLEGVCGLEGQVEDQEDLLHLAAHMGHQAKFLVGTVSMLS